MHANLTTAGRGARLPTRLIARAMSEFLLASARAWARPHGGDLTSAIVYCTILSANLDHLGYRTELSAAASAGTDGGMAERRPISANAIAQSLSLPYETVRRHVARLVAEHRLERRASGLIVSPASLDSPELVVARREIRAALDLMVATLERLGLSLRLIARLRGATIRAPIVAAPDALIARIVLDSQIRSLESTVSLFGDLLTGYVCTAIIAANVRNLLNDPELAWRYATQEALPPDALREPISLRQLARETEMPFETVRRQVTKLIDMKAAVRVDSRGVIVPAAVIAGEGTLRNHVKLLLEFTRMIGNLARAGYVFGTPASETVT